MKAKLLVLVIFLANITFGQSILPMNAPMDQLIDFGKPLFKSNATIVGEARKSSKCNGNFVVLVADKGQLSPTNGVTPVEIIKFYFIDFNSTSNSIENIPIKNLDNSVLTAPIGDIQTTCKGLDGCLYIGTNPGAYVLKVDYVNRTITNLGKPYNLNSGEYITTLMLGTDGAINGVYNEYYGHPARRFRYDYDCTFKELNSDYIDPNGSRTKVITSDATHQYARSERGDTYNLISINRQTGLKTEITLSYNGINLNTTTPFELQTFFGDYVYARASSFNGTSTYVWWRLENGQVVSTTADAYPTPYPNSDPTFDFTRKTRVDLIWHNYHSQALPTVIYNDIVSKIFVAHNGSNYTIDLSGTLTQHYQATLAIAPYFNSNPSSGNMELFVNGAKYGMAASLNVNLAQSSKLGVTSSSVYTSITDFDQANVWYAGYPAGEVSKYKSNLSWTTSNSANPPASTSNLANPRLYYSTHAQPRPSNPIYGPITVSDLKKIGANLLIVGGTNSRQYNHSIEEEEIGLSIINTNFLTNADAVTNIYYPAFDDYSYYSMDVNSVDGLIYIIGRKRDRVQNTNTKFRLFILNTSGVLINQHDLLDTQGNNTLYVWGFKSYGKSLYFTAQHEINNQTQYSILKIPDYTLSMSMQVMCHVAGLGSFGGAFASSLGISPNGKYLWAVCFKLNSNGEGIPIYMPTSTSNASYQANNYAINNVKIVNGIIPFDPLGNFQIHTVFINTAQSNYILISGKTSIYGFKPVDFLEVGF